MTNTAKEIQQAARLAANLVVSDAQAAYGQDYIQNEDDIVALEAVDALAATQIELDAHIDDAAGAHAATAILVDSADLTGTAVDVQAALVEIDAVADSATTHIANGTAAHAATAVSASSSTLVGTGTTVQAVLEELDNGVNLDNQVQAVAGVTATSLDAALGHVVTLAMGTDATQTVTITNLTAGQSVVVYATQNAAGSKALVFASTFFAGGTEPTMTATANAVDCYTIQLIGAQLYGFVGGQDLKT